METKSQITEREKIAERLKEARILSGLSQESAAKILKLQRPSISEIESAKRKVSAEEIIEFSNLYKVSASWLLSKEGEQEEEMNEQIKIAARQLANMKEVDRKRLLDILKIIPTK